MKSPVLLVAEKWRAWSRAQRGLVVVLAAGLAVLVAGSRPMGRRTERPTVASPPLAGAELQYAPAPPVPGPMREEDKMRLQAAQAPKSDAPDKDLERIDNIGPAESRLTDPLIAHTAELAVATTEFSKSRSSLEQILERHRAYAARLRMVGQKSGSVLNATLRVPSAELTETVSELKSLGDVEREEQAADEITQQQADLGARLANARKTLKRLQELLAKQTYPDGNVRELQRQIALAGTEVARLEAEQQASEHRVIFANVFFTLREEVAKPSESLGAQLRGAAAAGFGDAMASLVGLLAFLIGRGPVVLLWCAILWMPARFVWKRWAPVAARPGVVVPGN